MTQNHFNIGDEVANHIVVATHANHGHRMWVLSCNACGKRRTLRTSAVGAVHCSCAGQVAGIPPSTDLGPLLARIEALEDQLYRIADLEAAIDRLSDAAPVPDTVRTAPVPAPAPAPEPVSAPDKPVLPDPINYSAPYSLGITHKDIVRGHSKETGKQALQKAWARAQELARQDTRTPREQEELLVLRRIEMHDIQSHENDLGARRRRLEEHEDNGYRMEKRGPYQTHDD